MRDLRGSLTIVIAQKTIMNMFNGFYNVDQGEAIDEGTHESLLRQKGFYAELYHNQFVLE